MFTNVCIHFFHNVAFVDVRKTCKYDATVVFFNIEVFADLQVCVHFIALCFAFTIGYVKVNKNTSDQR